MKKTRVKKSRDTVPLRVTFPCILRHTKGIALFQNDFRSSLKPCLPQGRREGRGTLTWQTGAVYTGEWREDRKEGEGTLFYPNGDAYAGTWAAEKKSGQGTYLHAKGQTDYFRIKFTNVYTTMYICCHRAARGRSYAVFT